MSPQTATRRIDLTYEDYVLFPEDGKRHEIIDGDHYVTPAPNVKHQRVSFNLSKLFAVYLGKTRVGLALSAPCDVVLSDRDVVQPDLLFVSRPAPRSLRRRTSRDRPTSSWKSSPRPPERRMRF